MRTAELVAAIKAGKVTAEQNIEEKLALIEKRDKTVHAFLEVYHQEARERARHIDSKRKAGKPLGRLAGLAFAVKNNFAIEGHRLTCASRMLEQHVAVYTATAVRRALAEDAIIIGSTNMDEFACGSDGTHSAFGGARNPRDERLVPGGSSAGSAAAVAAGFADIALGSDTAGSIRCPAAFCGCAGLKPTNGLVSRHGLVDLAMSFDTVGPLARDAEGAALLLEVIAGEDARDVTTSGSVAKPYGQLLAQQPKSVGVLKEALEGSEPAVAERVRAAIDGLKARGVEIVELPSSLFENAVAAYYLICCVEFASGMQRYDGLRYGHAWKGTADMVEAASEARASSLGKEVRRRILLGTFVSTKEHRDAWYTTALRARARIAAEYERLFQKVDVIATPAMPVRPWGMGEKASPVEMYSADVLTAPANLGRVPAGVAPLGDGIAIQFAAPRFEDARVLACMRAVESIGEKQ